MVDESTKMPSNAKAYCFPREAGNGPYIEALSSERGRVMRATHSYRSGDIAQLLVRQPYLGRQRTALLKPERALLNAPVSK
jgi:hypothetical protein